MDYFCLPRYYLDPLTRLEAIELLGILLSYKMGTPFVWNLQLAGFSNSQYTTRILPGNSLH